MRKLILASKSKARQRLLRQIGLKFRVAGSHIKEESRLRGRCSEFVINNAVRKARDVAGRFNSGVVIAADTVVLVGKMIIGKPKNINDAYEALRILSRSPQWVYTGIAVVDIEKNNIFTDYEKTKVYMCRLADRQIRHYFKKISPFDKA